MTQSNTKRLVFILLESDYLMRSNYNYLIINLFPKGIKKIITTVQNFYIAIIRNLCFTLQFFVSHNTYKKHTKSEVRAKHT